MEPQTEYDYKPHGCVRRTEVKQLSYKVLAQHDCHYLWTEPTTVLMNRHYVRAFIRKALL